MSLPLITRGYLCRHASGTHPHRIVLPLKIKIKNKRKIKIFINKKCGD